MLKNFGILIIVFLLVFGCAGKDVLDKDKTPPKKPHLIAHRGDSGVTQNQTPLQYDNYFKTNGFEDNGIDAVDVKSNTIQICWDVLTDTDIDYLEIWRFNLSDPDTVMIAMLPDYNQTYYYDNLADYGTIPTGRDWFYFMKVYDTSGNYSVSDTVCYHLEDKAEINSPEEEITVSDFNEITFSWYVVPGTSAYLLLFDENFNLLKSYSALDEPNNMYQVSFSELNIDSNILQNLTKIYWEIVIDGSWITRTVNEKEYKVYCGSETSRRTIVKAK